MTNPTGDALKASAAQVRKGNDYQNKCDDHPTWGIHYKDHTGTHHNKIEVYGKDGEAIRDRILAALSTAEQSPQPVAVVTQPIGFMDVDGLGALVDEVRSRPTPPEAPPVESQAAEIGDLRDQRASLISRGIDPNLDHIPDHGLMGRWLPIEQADKAIIDVQEFAEVGMTLRNSDTYWVRDEDGRVYEAAWTEGRYGRDFWWDWEAESPVDPVEFMPHPLDPQFATSASEVSE